MSFNLWIIFILLFIHTFKEKYYYSIYDMTVRGSCSCYGHADSCKPAKPEHANIEGMVHGLCECEHNTMGNNCELCKPLYNDLQWKPATGKNKNECKSKLSTTALIFRNLDDLIEFTMTLNNISHFS